MRIVHISDLHFGMHHEFIVESFLKDLADIQPDLILISGDLTHRATDEQYKSFLAFVNQLRPVVCMVPGNHDIPLHNVLARLYNPFGQYKKHIHPTLTASFQNELVRVLGVNSVNPHRIKDGKLSSLTLDHIKEYFEPTFDGLSILFFHHNFDYIEGLHKPLENFQLFLDYLKKSSIDMVCTGHSHFASISNIEKINQQSSIVLHAGSLLCKRSKDGLNSYYVIETKKQGCNIDWRVFTNDIFETRSSSFFLVCP
ncbi:MAG: metallophosphoesterase [Legionella sp.]|nr:metallophosphoesterase [Legionella sp.]